MRAVRQVTRNRVSTPPPTDFPVGDASLAPESAVAILKQMQPVADSLRSVQTSWLTGLWQAVAIGALKKLHDASLAEPQMVKTQRSGYATWAAHTASDVRNWAITAGIATEKVLLLSGQPTQIVASINEVRVSLPELVERMSGVARALRSGPAALPAVVSEPEVIEANDVSTREHSPR